MERNCELKICDSYNEDDEIYIEYFALDNQEDIIKTARVFNSFGKQILYGKDSASDNHEEFMSELEDTYRRNITLYYSPENAYTHKDKLRSVVHTVDTLVEWLERSGNEVVKDLKKKEAVLRGVLRLTDLGNQASLFGMLELACKFLDVPKNPYPAEREYIQGSLAEVKEQKETIFGILRDAGETLRSIINDEIFDITKGMQFDNNMRQAQLEIQICLRHLDRAKKMILQLMQKMRLAKWFSRVFRTVAIAIYWYFMYQKYHDLTIGLRIVLLGLFASAMLWLYFSPSNSYAFYDALSKLDVQHKLLNEGLDDIKERLKSTADHKDEVVGD